jgi:hypothetical protein
MQPTRNTPNKKVKFLDMKVFIATLAFAIAVGLWNLLSNNAVQADKAAPPAVVTLPPQTPAGEAQGFPPLPTLVPLIDVSSSQPVSAPQTSQLQAGVQTGSLRSVTAPDQTIVQKVKPQFDQAVVTISGGGGGGGGSSRPAPVTSTSSSHK